MGSNGSDMRESRWPGRVRWLADRATDPARPLFCSLVFWITVVVTLVAETTNYTGTPRPLGPGPVVGCLALMSVLWLALPWSPDASAARKAVHVPFVVILVVINLLTPYGAVVVWVLLALANCTFLFGVRGVVVLTAVFLAYNFAATRVYLGHSVMAAVVQSLVIPALAVFVVGLVSAVTEAKARREESQRLLGQLSAAHAELRAYADQVRELAVADERARMAREMHDSIGHYLTVIKVGLTNAERFRELRPDQAWAEVRQAMELTQDALADTRRWVRAMRPLALDGHTGSAALAELARSFDGTGIEVDFQVEGREQPLLGDTELVLYRVLQEGLTNVLRHASARRANAVLAFEADRVSLAIGDDGVGAAPSALTRGFGLSSLAERAQAAGGTLVAANAERGGFLLCADLPVKRA